MTSKMLQKARDFEKKYLPYTQSEQPRFHVTGGIGWINDPNGFAPYKGEYHLFFQYHPYDTKWGPMHWGHVKTRDFIHWERLPAALAPDTEYDRNGCFSGGAVELPDGRHLLMYTGVRCARRRNGKIDEYQTQCLAIGDGVDYEKLPCNPVIDASQLPEGGSVHDFRDPKIWQPLRRRQRHDPPLSQRGRAALGIRQRRRRLPQPVRADVGVPGSLPTGWEGRAVCLPAGDDGHRA